MTAITIIPRTIPPTINPVFICAFDGGEDETGIDAVSDGDGVVEGSDGKLELVVVEIEFELGEEGSTEFELVPGVTVEKLTAGIDGLGTFPCKMLLQQSPTKHEWRQRSPYSVRDYKLTRTTSYTTVTNVCAVAYRESGEAFAFACRVCNALSRVKTLSSNTVSGQQAWIIEINRRLEMNLRR